MVFRPSLFKKPLEFQGKWPGWRDLKNLLKTWLEEETSGIPNYALVGLCISIVGAFFIRTR